jgi:adenine-specific DNA-methyltransferase
MEHLKMKSPDIVSENMAYIAERWPECLTEAKDENGKLRQVIDFDKLRQVLSADATGEGQERYQFTWPDKRHAIRLANTPTTDTLRPCREESMDFDNTQNLYIEGDNLDVLKLLRESYLGKVKMIYIDPPYNTGGDFVYKDNFIKKNSDYAEISGAYDEEGNQTVDEFEKNSDSNGRFHTDWLNMIYPRLKVARDLLTEDGVIFISIDDNEQKNLKNVCDEVLGGGNFLAQVVWERAYAPINLMKHFSPSHDYILVYAKNIENAFCYGIERSQEANDRYSNPDNDPRGVWKASDLSVGPAVAENIYTITTPSGREVEPPAGRSWSLSRKAFRERLQDNRIWFGPEGNNVPAMKRFLSELRKTGMTPMTIWKHEEVDHSQGATQKLAALFDGKKYFDYPKPVTLIQRCLQLYTNNEDLILDFFSGSGTTAHAVMQQNANDEGKRKYICVQLPEETSEESPARKAGYATIPEIAKERIRRAGKKIKEESLLTSQDIDTGFRVLKLDSSNMENVFYTPAETTEQMLFADNIKPDRTDEDLLFQVMMELGIVLSDKIEKTEIAGKTVWNVGQGYLMACFEPNVTEETITAIAKQQPQYFVIADRSLASDNVADNFEQVI